jgi:urease accessory protein
MVDFSRIPSTMREEITRLKAPRRLVAALIPLGAILAPMTAAAHEETGVAGGLLSGLLHPLSGPDHVVAMVAVGLLGAIMGPPAIWALPVTFPLVMALGGTAGIVGIPLPGVEIGIALSGVVLGLLIACFVKPPLPIAALLVGGFAVFHGHAHGTELPSAAAPLAYGVGFVTATGLLHLGGIVLGLLVHGKTGRIVVRTAGGTIAAVGFYFLVH